MCLTNLTTEEPLIATKDIVVWKILDQPGYVKNMQKYHGQKCIATIQSSIIDNAFTEIDGIISIDDNNLYICHNNYEFDGAVPLSMFECKYGWVLDKQVMSIIIDGKQVLSSMLATPYRSMKIKIGNLYESKIRKNLYGINEALHSYEFLEDVKKLIRGKQIIAKCIIPKGSKYYKGTFDKCSSIASNQLKYVKLVK